MSFALQLKKMRKEAGLSQAKLSEYMSVSQQAVAKWESGKSMPEAGALTKLAQVLNTTVDELLSGGIQAARSAGIGYTPVPIPVIGTVRAGYGALAFEEDYGTEMASVKDPESYFYLVVKGDSMEPRIQEGDLALVHRQPTLENGDLGVLIYDDEESTLKRFLIRGSSVVLQPFNPQYREKIISGEDLNHLHVVGKVVKTVSQW